MSDCIKTGVGSRVENYTYITSMGRVGKTLPTLLQVAEALSVPIFKERAILSSPKP
ncbi:hypothetical protein [Moorena sp. SIO3H5]|uniref:hypothetical protein n=1 Tax=Moorena sp. SIO3H5 TaxID=2607834 RepID=UPI0013B7A485|nr:hypothetical protein [Moorena sp. SIO3H5]NEO70038.1 hypothetical protein [Moorena sp. SIO3H5]